MNSLNNPVTEEVITQYESLLAELSLVNTHIQQYLNILESIQLNISGSKAPNWCLRHKALRNIKARFKKYGALILAIDNLHDSLKPIELVKPIALTYYKLQAVYLTKNKPTEKTYTELSGLLRDEFYGLATNPNTLRKLLLTQKESQDGKPTPQ